MRTFKTILVTGGAGFIGSNLIHYLFGQAGFTGQVVKLDALVNESVSDNRCAVGTLQRACLLPNLANLSEIVYDMLEKSFQESGTIENATKSCNICVWPQQ
jgi:nucleoside-diphosphate-sugar epimerase